MSIRTAAAHRNLLYLLSRRELRTRYKRSLLGWLWSLLNPLVQMAIFSVIFLYVFVQKAPVGDPSGLESFPLYFLCGFIPFNFFSLTVGVSIGTVQGGASLIKKVAFPHEHLVLSVVFAQFVTVLIELGVLTVAMLIAGNMVLPWLPVLFVIMVLLAIFSTGVAMLLASANVYFNDVTYLWAIAAQLLFYATPVIWDPRVGRREVADQHRQLAADRRLRHGDPRGDVRPAHAEPGALRPAHGRTPGCRWRSGRGASTGCRRSSRRCCDHRPFDQRSPLGRGRARHQDLPAPPRAGDIAQAVITGGRRRDFDDFVALDDVSFNVRRGEVFGVIGHNGSGKSTMLKCMASIIQPTRGAVRVHDRMSALLELGAGFHPELTGRENVYLNAAILGMTRREIAERFDEIVDFAGLETVHRHAGEELLLGHVRAARRSRSRSTSSPTCCSSTRSWPSATSTSSASAPRSSSSSATAAARSSS